MTRKDYIAIAGFIAEERRRCGEFDDATWERLVDKLVALLQADNPRFDEQRFRQACKGGGDGD